ncbi:MAG TPA: hypothetical protein VE196_09220 [Pseudonocardiaceae bacterium]|nr:hypothetical protein [Pseudonocardiaceae bacterium]
MSSTGLAGGTLVCAPKVIRPEAPSKPGIAPMEPATSDGVSAWGEPTCSSTLVKVSAASKASAACPSSRLLRVVSQCYAAVMST